MRIETGRLDLIPMTAEDLSNAAKDLAAVVRLYGASTPCIGFWDMRAKRKIYRAKAELLRRKPRAWLLGTSWLVIERGEGIYVGEAGLKGPPQARHTVEIGYGLLEDYRNKGYMTEAVGALTRLALFQQDFRVESVTALTLPGNIASHRVLVKNRYIRQPSYGKYWLWERVKLPEDTAEGIFD